MAEDVQKNLKVEVGPNWVQILVRVQPRSSKDEVAGVMGGSLKIRLRAPPLEGKANRALQSFLARRLRIPKGAVEIISGHTARTKRVRLYGLSKKELLVGSASILGAEEAPDG